MDNNNNSCQNNNFSIKKYQSFVHTGGLNITERKWASVALTSTTLNFYKCFSCILYRNYIFFENAVQI